MPGSPGIPRNSSAKELVSNSSSVKRIYKSSSSSLSDPNLLPTIGERLEEMASRNRSSLDLHPIIAKIHAIAIDEEERFILIRSLLDPIVSNALTTREDLLRLHALPPLSLAPPDIESFTLHHVRASLGHTTEQLNNKQLFINGSRFQAHSREILPATRELLEKIHAAGWDMPIKKIQRMAKKLHSAKHTEVTKLFQAASPFSIAHAMPYLKRKDSSEIRSEGLPRLYILSNENFAVIHKKVLSFKKGETCRGYVSNTYSKGIWRTDLYVMDIPGKREKELKLYLSVLKSSPRIPYKDFLLHPKFDLTLETLLQQALGIIPMEYFSFKFQTPDEFYVVLRSLLTDREARQKLEEIDPREKHLALTEFTTVLHPDAYADFQGDRKRDTAANYLQSDKILSHFGPHLLNRFDIVQTSEPSCKFYKLKSGRFTMIRSANYSFNRERSELFSASLHVSITYVHGRYVLKYFLTHIRATDKEKFENEALPLFEAYEQGLNSPITL